MTTDATKTILGAIICKPSLLESHEDLSADLFLGKDREVFEAVAAIWADRRPDSIDIGLLAKQAKVDLMFLSDLLDYAQVAGVQPDGFRHQVEGLVKDKVGRDMLKRLEKAVKQGTLDDTISEIKPLLRKYETAGDKEKRLSDQVRLWVENDAHGEFSVATIYDNLGVQSINGKANVRQILARMVKEGLIDYVGHKNGWYRRVDRLASPIDLTAVAAKPLDLYLPLGLGNLVNIYSKSIIVCSGVSQQGKTAIALDMVKNNMRQHDVRYFFSEGGPEELRSRVEQHADLTIPEWTMLPFEHSGHPADVVGPDAVNVYDYLRVTGEGFYSVDDMLSDVHKKLNKGIAFINLQKSKHKELGDGGEFGLRIPRLYFTLNPDPDGTNSMDKQSVIAKIVKAKGWKCPGRNPDGRVMPFTIRDGWQISHGTEWVYPESLCAAKTKRLYH